MQVNEKFRIGLKGLVLGLCLLAIPAMVGAQAWLDNERQFKSNDPKYNVRRSEHFRIMWGKGVAANADENADFDRVTEQLAQGNLQMLEAVWHRYHDPESAGGMGYDQNRGKSSNPKFNDDNFYRVNLVMNNTGIWAGGAWGACDEWGYPLFALPPTYLAFDPPSGATPHEYGHTCHINAGGFNDTPYDGMWHEATANWVMLQFNNAYPTPGFAIQPYLSLTHGRNYYDAWPLYEYLRQQPGYGYAFFNKLWTQANGTKSKGGEYIYDAMARLDDKHGPDSYNAIKDMMGQMAAHNITWDYDRGQFFRKHVAWNYDPLDGNYRRAYTELIRRDGDTVWFRGPFAHAPMQAGYNMVPIALVGKQKGQPYKVSVNFRPVWDPIRRSDMRATLVAVSDNGDPRYSDEWNGGVNSITLSDDENKVFLVVSATPDFMGYEGFGRPLVSDLPLQPQAYEVSFPADTKATVFESVPAKPNVAGHAHSNGGGFVADSAKVDATAYVGPNAMVLGNAQVLGKARVGDYAVVIGNAVVKDNARISGHALVKDSAQVYDNGKVRDWATITGNWKIYENGRALEGCTLMGGGELHGCATEKGNTCDYGNIQVKGTAIKEYDTANGCNLDKSTLMCWVWGADQGYGDRQPDNGGLYCGFTFEPTDAVADKAKLDEGKSPYGTDAADKPIVWPRSNSIYAHDTFGVVHGYLMGGPKVVEVNDKALGSVLAFNGKDQYVELRRDAADFNDTTIAMWVDWAGGAAGQRILNFGDGAGKYAYITPKGDSGKVAFVISNNGKAAEQKLEGSAALPANTWTHIAVILMGDTGMLFIDGKPVATNSKMTLNPDDVLAQNSLAGNDCNFLARGPKADYFKGMIDDFRVYVRPQDSSFIANLAGLVTNKNAAVVASAKDKDPMAPTFLAAPKAISAAAIQMSATRPADKAAWFEYSFTCTSGGGHNSGWISSNRFTDCNLTPGSYSYTVKMRNKDGKESAACAPASATISVPTSAPKAEFASGPRGISDSAIKMVAAKPADAFGKVEYKFNRGTATTGWQSSPTWTDKDLQSGQDYSYTVEVRDSRGKSSTLQARGAVARDDTPPARFKLGEWQTEPYSKVDNTLCMKAMSPTEWKTEDDKVEYYFHCVSGGGPDSEWQDSNVFTTAVVPDGAYVYEFKMRDTSPQHNETPYSAPMTVKVTNMTGYHPYAISALKDLPEGALVSIKGKVTSVEKDHYVLTAADATCSVVPKAKGDATDAGFNGKDVTAYGCWWKYGDEMRITWAELR